MTTESSTILEHRHDNLETQCFDTMIKPVHINEVQFDKDTQYVKASVSGNSIEIKSQENLHSLYITKVNTEVQKLPTNRVNDKHQISLMNNPECTVSTEICQNIKPTATCTDDLTNKTGYKNECQIFLTLDSTTNENSLAEEKSNFFQQANTKEYQESESNTKLISEVEDISQGIETHLENCIPIKNKENEKGLTKKCLENKKHATPKLQTLRKIFQDDSSISGTCNYSSKQTNSLLQTIKPKITSKEEIDYKICDRKNKITLKKNEILEKECSTVDMASKLMRDKETPTWIENDTKSTKSDDDKLVTSGVIKASCETNRERKDACKCN